MCVFVFEPCFDCVSCVVLNKPSFTFEPTSNSNEKGVKTKGFCPQKHTNTHTNDKDQHSVNSH